MLRVVINTDFLSQVDSEGARRPSWSTRPFVQRGSGGSGGELHLAAAGHDDRLAGSYPFLTMLSVAVSGWLMERQLRAAAGSDAEPGFLAMKSAAARFYLEQVVPEAIGLAAAATAPADLLYSVAEEAFAA